MKRSRQQRLKIFTAVADSAQLFVTPSPVTFTNIFSDVGDSARKFKTAIVKPKPSQFWIFLPISWVSNPYRSELCKNPGAEYLKLGPLLRRPPPGPCHERRPRRPQCPSWWSGTATAPYLACRYPPSRLTTNIFPNVYWRFKCLVISTACQPITRKIWLRFLHGPGPLGGLFFELQRWR